MIADEWLDVVDWYAPRYPDTQWSPEQAVAYLADVRQFDAVDVWEAITELYEAGSAFPPSGSELVAATRKVVRERAYQATLDRPMLEAKGVVSWGDWCELRFGEKLSPRDVLVVLHTERTDCLSSSCDIHGDR